MVIAPNYRITLIQYRIAKVLTAVRLAEPKYKGVAAAVVATPFLHLTFLLLSAPLLPMSNLYFSV
jgi:hypothetical protein